MKRTVFHVALALAAFLGAHGAQATQTVRPAADAAGAPFTLLAPNSWGVSRGGGQQLVFYGRYESGNASESGLGLKIQYDAAKITGVTIDQVVTKCMVFTPDVLVNGASSQVLFGWADTSQRAGGAVGWPGLVDGAPPCINPAPPAPPVATTTAAFTVPTTLFRFTATTAAGFTSGTSTIAISSPSASSAAGTAAFTNTSLVVTGGAPPACNLDVDNDGLVLAAKDGILLQRALNPNITDANVIAGITITGSRNTGALIRTYLNTFMSGVGTLANLGATPIDIDSNGSTTAATDGNAVKRALNVNITAANVVLGLAVAPGTTGQSVRTVLNNNCGLSLPTN